jgi:hypothetical protein
MEARKVNPSTPDSLTKLTITKAPKRGGKRGRARGRGVARGVPEGGAPRGGRRRGAAVEVESGSEDDGAIEAGGAGVEGGNPGDLSAPTQEQEIGGIGLEAADVPGAGIHLESRPDPAPPPALAAKQSAANLGRSESTPKRKSAEVFVMNDGSTMNETESSRGVFLFASRMDV